jgi:hypothetical protein
MPRRRLASLAILGLLLSPLSLRAAQAEPPPAEPSPLDRFRAEYPQAMKSLESRYNHMELRGRQTMTNQKRSEDTQLTFYVNGDRVRLDRDIKEIEDGKQGQRQTRGVATPSLAFSVERAAENNRFALSNLDKSSGGYLYALDLIRTHGMFARAPYGVLDGTIADFMAEKQFKITAVTQEADDVKVEFDSPLANQGRSGWWQFRPNQSWALQAWELRFQKPGEPAVINAVTLQYHGEADGVPLLESVRLVRTFEGRKVQEEEFRVESIRFGNPPDDVFTLAAFGISNSVGGQPARLRGGLFWFFLLMTAMALAGIWFFRRLSQRRAS